MGYTNPYSISFWAKPNSTAYLDIISHELASGAYTGYDIALNTKNDFDNSPGYLTFVLSNTWSTNTLCVYTTNQTKLNDGSWHHYEFTYDGSHTPSGVKIYEDGVSLAISTTYNSLSATSLASAPLYVPGNYSGQLDEERISSVARSAGWIATEYNNQNSPSTFFSVGNLENVPVVSWYNSSYLYRKAITIDHTKVSGGSNLTNFPVLISLTDTNLKTTGNGGYVQNTSGYDIVFTDSTGTTKLDHEIEKYVPTTGEIAMWVRVPTLSASADTVLYMYFDNSSISSSQENKTGVWDSNYLGVWHMDDNAANTTVSDSCANANTATNAANTSTKTTTGYIANGLTYNGSSDYSNTTTAGYIKGQSQVTISAWVKSTVLNSARHEIFFASTNQSGYTRLALCLETTNKFSLIGRTADGDSLTTLKENSTALSTGAWYYVVGVYDSTNSINRLMVNGVDQTSTRTQSAFSTTTPYGTPDIGRQSDGSYYWNGTLDEVRVSQTARSADWSTTEYNNQNSPSTFFAVGALTAASSSVSPTSNACVIKLATNQIYTVTTNGNTLSSVSNTTTGDTLTAGTDYTWDNGTGALVILAAYLNNLNTHQVANGSNTIMLSMSGGTNPTISLITTNTHVSFITPFTHGAASDTTYDIYGPTFQSVKNGGTTLTQNTHYTYSSNVLTLYGTYLNTLAAGTYTIGVYFTGPQAGEAGVVYILVVVN